jgi:hypothetical protein
VLRWSAAKRNVAELLHGLNAALGKADAENIVIGEVLPEIKSRR